jgi:hypothetical protein
LNSERGAASNCRLTYRKFFSGGDGKPLGEFFNLTGAASPFVPTISLGGLATIRPSTPD